MLSYNYLFVMTKNEHFCISIGDIFNLKKELWKWISNSAFSLYEHWSANLRWLQLFPKFDQRMEGAEGRKKSEVKLLQMKTEKTKSTRKKNAFPKHSELSSTHQTCQSVLASRSGPYVCVCVCFIDVRGPGRVEDSASMFFIFTGMMVRSWEGKNSVT